jgi:hypothetical protein
MEYMKNERIERIATSIKVKPDVWKEAKKSAIDHDLELSELVEEAILEWIKENKK